MALPMIAPQTPDGVVRGLQDFVDRSGVPLIVYIKTDGYVPAKAIGRLVEQGAVFGIKYAVWRNDLKQDAYLQELIDAVGRSASSAASASRRPSRISRFQACRLHGRLRLHRAPSVMPRSVRRP